MSEELMLDVGQANELKLAARRAGATNADLKRLSEGDAFARILPVLRGLGEVTITKYLVDLSADPMVPKGWEVVEHRRGDKEFLFDPAKVVLYLDGGQKGGRTIKGNELRNKLSDQPVFNANLLDFYLANPHLIPEEWKGKAVFFWGTIYRDSNGGLCVRYLIWFGSGWYWHFYWLGSDWFDNNPAASRK
ncbi:MAG: hypothetical protein NTY11_03265 [Candidatus Parcubacteria bacterium]|nr:hypothetical protein [Candidatus Parcubacteria bacterium]